MMKSFSIPALNTLNSSDANSIRQIVASLVFEIENLNKRINSLENNTQTSMKKEKYYGV